MAPNIAMEVSSNKFIPVIFHFHLSEPQMYGATILIVRGACIITQCKHTEHNVCK